MGRENLQKFRLVAQEKTKSPKSGKVVSIVGSYDPIDSENKLVFDAEKIEQFVKNGAELSDTVARLLLKNGFKRELAEKFVKKYSKQKPKKAEEDKPAAETAKSTDNKEAVTEDPKLDEEPKEKKATVSETEEKPATEDSSKEEDKKDS